MTTYYFTLKSTRQGPFIGMTDDKVSKVVSRMKSVYGRDLEKVYELREGSTSPDDILKIHYQARDEDRSE